MSVPSEEKPSRRRTLVIANPIAGSGRGERAAREIAEGLRARGGEVELHLTRGRGDAVERVTAERANFDQLVSVGGDGTLREVLEGLDGERTPVAIYPLGTANVLSIDLALPRDVPGLLRVIERGRTQTLDVARVNGHLSFLVSGVGLDARAVREVELARRGPISKSTYIGAMLRALRGYKAPELALEIDGERLDFPVGQVLISNIVHYGGVFRLSSQRALDDGFWEVYLFRDARLHAMAAAGLRGFFASLPGGSCEMRRARRVRVTSSEPVAYHVDGDFRGETPLDFEVSPVRRTVLVP
jgi:YegS/Rv2252/BmrU family lipid kinase